MSHSHEHARRQAEYDTEDAELIDALGNIWDIAEEHHLDPFPTAFEVAPANVVYQIGAYGIPGRYSHWTHGRAYSQMKTQYDYGLSKIYELVINSNPSQAYLLENNPPIANKFVMAHVLGHTDFFKNNHTFARTRRDMPEAVAMNASRIRDYERAAGPIEVERFLDAALAIEQYVDPYQIDRPLRDDELAKWRDDAEREHKPRPVIATEFDDLFDPPSPSTEQNLGKRALAMIPPQPDSDILGFIRNHAPYLNNWQRDVVDIVRAESLYFYPQRRTKIMNEGWAAYWHKRIMREMGDRGHLSDSENEDWWALHSGVVAPNPKSLNPYYLGMKMYEYLEDYYNGTLEDHETAYLQRQGVQTYPRYEGPLADSPAMPHLRDAMMYNDDQSFIRNHFNKIIADRMEMYLYEQVGEKDGEPVYEVVNNSWSMIRDQLVQSMDNNGVPAISVRDGDYDRRGELYLQHEFDGRMLDPDYVRKTLPYVYTLWQRPVYLETRDSETDAVIVYRYDGTTAEVKTIGSQ